jgi:tetratricopeptide (TPR) repeat protein
MSLTLIVVLVLALLISIGGYIYFVGGKYGFDEKILALAKAGKFKEAKTLIKDKIDLKPDDPVMHNLMASVFKIEGNLEEEAQELEKIVANGKFTKEISSITVSNRLASIYYQIDKYEESFFYYLDLIENDPGNLEAIIRLSFLAIGQREFEVADKFLKTLPDSQIKLSAFFVAKGVISTMLGREDDFDFYKKAYDLDKNSMVAKFLYAFSYYQRRNFKEALKLVDSLIDLSIEEYIKLTFIQFLIVQYLCLNDYSSAMLNTRVAIDIARKNNWENELADLSLYYGMFCLASNDLEKSSEYLIEAEYLKPNDKEIIDLANYKYDLEEGTAFPGAVSPRGFNLASFIANIPEKLFPPEKAYEISGLSMPVSVNIRGIVNKEGNRLITKITQLSPDKILKFNSLRGLQYKNVCTKILNNMNYKLKKELPGLELEGSNILAVNRDDENEIALFRFRKWKSTSLSDIFLNDLLSSMKENGAQKAYLIASCELTTGAKKLLKANDNVLNVINERILDKLLDGAIK